MSSDPGGHSTEATPKLHGPYGESFDRQLGRWLPVYSNQVSPDGLRYAYFDTTNNPTLVVVEVASGTSTVAFVADPVPIWGVIAYRPEGIYVTHGNGPGGGDRDADRLWRLTQSGTLTAVGDKRSVGGWLIAGGFAWGVETDDPSKLGQPGNEERVIRVDLKSGTASVWLRRIGAPVETVGVEPDGSALILVGNPLALWRVVGPGTEQQVAEMGSYGVGTASDSRGIWLSNDRGTWLVTPAGQAIQISPQVYTPAGNCG